MLKKAVLSMFLLATVSLALGFGSPVFAMDMNLVGLLVKNLGVTQGGPEPFSIQPLKK